jgi:hypothetical protein
MSYDDWKLATPPEELEPEAEHEPVLCCPGCGTEQPGCCCGETPARALQSAVCREIADELLGIRRLLGDMLDECAGGEVPTPGEAKRLVVLAKSAQSLIERALLRSIAPTTPEQDRAAQVVMAARTNARADENEARHAAAE